jgi:ribosomal protein L37AE/L43A
MHLNNVHGRIKTQYQCPSCVKTHPSSTKLRIHIENVHLKRKTKCPLCNRLVTYHGLRNHIRVLHGGDRINKPYKCNECDFSSHADKYLKTHILKRHKKDAHTHACDQCDKKFAYPHQLSDHKEMIHDSIKTFMCEKCGKGFPKRLKTSFDKHVQQGDCLGPKKEITRTLKVINCSSCDMTFAAPSYYIQHHQQGNLLRGVVNKTHRR